MILSIYTDGSHSPHTNDAGYAFWIDSYQVSAQKAGYIPVCSHSTKAELYAINSAVEDLLTRELIPIVTVDIYTDSTEAISKIRSAGHTAFFSMIEFTQKNGMRARQVFDLFKLHHVKAHTKQVDEASNKNHYVDFMAKNARRTKAEFKATIFDNSDILL